MYKPIRQTYLSATWSEALDNGKEQQKEKKIPSPSPSSNSEWELQACSSLNYAVILLPELGDGQNKTVYSI